MKAMDVEQLLLIIQSHNNKVEPNRKKSLIMFLFSDK